MTALGLWRARRASTVRAMPCMLVVAVGLSFTNGPTRADDAGAGGRRATVVAWVGPREITVGDLEDRIGGLPPFQRASMGRTADAVRRRILNDVVLREALLSLAADSEQLGDKPPAAFEIERARSASTIRAIRARIGPAASIPDDEIRAYYDANRARYDLAERYQIWRILCATREDAQAVLDDAKRNPAPANFAALARERSLDKATNLRSGNLGFLAADGTSSEPGLRVDPSVVRAAQAVADGSLVPEPVPEGTYFSVVWRRGTLAASKHPVEEVAAQIRDAIWKMRVKEETDRLLVTLRADRVHDADPSLLATLDLPVTKTAVVNGPSGTPR